MSPAISKKVIAVFTIIVVIVGAGAYYVGDMLAYQRGYRVGYEDGYRDGLGAVPTPEKRVLRINYANLPYIDPAVGSDEASSSSFVLLYDSLVYPTPDGDIKPHLAERWEVSEDGLTWTFYLRSGVKFHDGSEVTAEDVKFSMDRLITIGEGYSYLFVPYIEATEVLNKYVVRFKLKEPLGPFLAILIRLYILNKDLVLANIKTPGPYGEYGDYAKPWLLEHDAGSGPYKLKEFRRGDRVIMERFEDYWGDFVANAPDEVIFYGNPEPALVRTMVARRELEITDSWQPMENYEAMDKIRGVDVAVINPGTTMFYYMIHCRKPPTDCIHFRKAMAWAMDYETVVREIYPGSKLARGPVPSGLPGHNPNVFQYTRNLEKAIEELRQSKYWGQLDQYPIEVHWCAEVPPEERVAILFAQCMEEIGIKVNVVQVPWLTMIDEMADMERSPHIATVFVAAHYPEAGSILASRYHSRSAPTWEQNEWLLDPEIDAMIEDALATINRTERFQKYYALQEKIVDLCPSLFLFEYAERHAYQAYYIDWPAARGITNPVMGYMYDARFIAVYPEKRKELLK